MSEEANEGPNAPQQSEERPPSTLVPATGASSGPGDGRTANANAAAGTTTVTITETETQESAEVLRLTLRPRPTVRWDEDVVDNEGMGKKSSKRCCIFHKQRAFGESSTDSSDYDSDDGGKKQPGKGKIARPKKNDKVPDYQRFHA